MSEAILSPISKSLNLLPWKVAFVVQFNAPKFGLTFHAAPKTDTGNGIYTVSLLEIPRHDNPQDRGPAELYNASLRPDQQHLALRPGLYLSHLNDIHVINMPCEEVIKKLKSVGRPVKLRFVDVEAGTVSLDEVQAVTGQSSLVTSARKLTDLPSLSTKVVTPPQEVPSPSPKAGANSLDMYKIVLVGSAGVGKSSLLSVCIKGNDSFEERLPSTLQPEFGSITVPAPGSTKSIHVRIWDTAGQERYQAITRSHYRRADGAILVYDVGDHKSFDLAQKWLKDIKEAAAETICAIMVLENKIDLLPEIKTGKEIRSKQFVDSHIAEAFCNRNGLLFARTTAKQNAVAHKWDGQKIFEAVKTLVLNIHAVQLERERQTERKVSTTSIKLVGRNSSTNGSEVCGTC